MVEFSTYVGTAVNENTSDLAKKVLLNDFFGNHFNREGWPRLSFDNSGKIRFDGVPLTDSYSVDYFFDNLSTKTNSSNKVDAIGSIRYFMNNEISIMIPNVSKWKMNRPRKQKSCLFVLKLSDDEFCLVTNISYAYYKNSNVTQARIDLSNSDIAYYSNALCNNIGSRKESGGNNPISASGNCSIDYEGNDSYFYMLGTSIGKDRFNKRHTSNDFTGITAEFISPTSPTKVALIPVYTDEFKKINNLYLMAYGCAISPSVGSTVIINSKRYIVLGITGMSEGEIHDYYTAGYGHYLYRID